jgi:hypothetical protein
VANRAAVTTVAEAVDAFTAFYRTWRNAAYRHHRDEQLALEAFIADGGNPSEVERIERAFGVGV